MLGKVLLTLCLLCTVAVNGFFVTLDAHAEECYFDKVTAGTKLGNSLLVLFIVISVALCNCDCTLF